MQYSHFCFSSLNAQKEILIYKNFYWILNFLLIAYEIYKIIVIFKFIKEEDESYKAFLDNFNFSSSAPMKSTMQSSAEVLPSLQNQIKSY